MNLEERKEDLIQQYKSLTVEIKQKTELMLKVLGAIELLEQMEAEAEGEEEK